MDDFLDIEQESCPAGGVHSIVWLDNRNPNVDFPVCVKCKTHGSSVCGVLSEWGKKLTEQECKIVMDKIRRKNIKKGTKRPLKHCWEKEYIPNLPPDRDGNAYAYRCKRCYVEVSSGISIEKRIRLIDLDEDPVMPWCFLPGEEDVWEII